MRNRYLLVVILLALFLFPGRSRGQMVGDCVFLKGKYVEVGVAPNGGYGSTLPAPAGYHPNLGGGTITFYDPAAATNTTSNQLLGFVADYGADGWTTGTPGYFGDYYLPGTPQEGWALQVGTQRSNAYIPAYGTTGTTGYFNTGGATLAGTNAYYTNSGGVSKGVWEGTQGALAIRQTTILDTNKLYFTVNVVIANNGTTPLSDIYYLRTVDPDNEETTIGPAGFTTINTITYQLPNPSNRVLVSATGVVNTNAYLGLGTKDCRAKCVFYDFGLDPGANTLQNIFDESTSFHYTQGSVSTSDVGIGLVFNVGTIAAGDSTSLSYAYILNSTYIDSALNATSPQFTVNNVTHDSTDTINLCTYAPDTVLINMVNGGFYHWHYSPDSFLTDTTGVSVVIHSDSVTASSITYTITGTNASGGCDSVHYYVTLLHAAYPGPVTAPVTYCQFGPSGPLTAPGTNLRWWTSATGGVSSTVAPTPSTLVAGTTTYYVSETFGLCESARSPLTVTVKPLPPPPSITGLTPYCFGQTFVPFTTAGTDILWYTTLTGGVGVTTSPTVYTGAAGVTTFYASQTVDGCEGPRSGFATTVLPQIIPGYTFARFYGCHGDTVRFTNSSVNATKYTWAFGDGSSDTAANPVHIYSVQGSYTAKLYAINAGGCADSLIQTIDLIHALNAAYTATPDIICQKQSVSFTNTSIGIDSSFVWYFGNGDTSWSVNPTYTYNHTGIYNAMLVVRDFVPCYDTAYKTIYVDTISGISLELTDTVLCGGTNVTLTGLYAGIGNTGITWVFGDNDSIKNVNPLYHAYAAGQYTITATAHYRACQDTSASRTITVFAQPTIDLGRDQTICKGSESITLKDERNSSNPGASYVWSTGERTRAITIVAPGNYYATVNINNCYASDSVEVTNDCYMSLPNVFSPNGDGVNDYFFPRPLLAKGLTAFKMSIYNRWGQLIFETTNIDGSGWDGRLNDVDQPVGVYVYNIDATFRDGQSEHHQGNVTLLR